MVNLSVVCTSMTARLDNLGRHQWEMTMTMAWNIDRDRHCDCDCDKDATTIVMTTMVDWIRSLRAAA